MQNTGIYTWSQTSRVKAIPTEKFSFTVILKNYYLGWLKNKQTKKPTTQQQNTCETLDIKKPTNQTKQRAYKNDFQFQLALHNTSDSNARFLFLCLIAQSMFSKQSILKIGSLLNYD